VTEHKIGVIIPTMMCETLFRPEDAARLEGLAPTVWTDLAEHLSGEQAGRLLADCTIGVGSWGTPYPCGELMASCPDLQLWEHVGGTVKHMFGPHLEGRDLTIASCSPAVAENVAEMTLGLIILGRRRAFANAAANRLTYTPKSEDMRVLRGATVGVVGASEVGKRVIAHLHTFACRVRVYDPFLSDPQAEALGATPAGDLTELCAECDVVTLHTPALPSTENMMGAAQFQAMRDDAVFVNTARGSCVDHAALEAELVKGRLLALLDVTLPEPLAEDSPLRTLPNVVLTSHLAGGGPNVTYGTQAVDDVAAFIRDESPLFVVTPDMLDRLA